MHQLLRHSAEDQVPDHCTACYIFVPILVRGEHLELAKCVLYSAVRPRTTDGSDLYAAAELLRRINRKCIRLSMVDIVLQGVIVTALVTPTHSAFAVAFRTDQLPPEAVAFHCPA